MTEKKFLIQVLTLDNSILKFKVQSYEVSDGMVYFTDPKNGMAKTFPTSRTTIDQVVEWIAPGNAEQQSHKKILKKATAQNAKNTY